MAIKPVSILKLNSNILFNKNKLIATIKNAINTKKLYRTLFSIQVKNIEDLIKALNDISILEVIDLNKIKEVFNNAWVYTSNRKSRLFINANNLIYGFDLIDIIMMQFEVDSFNKFLKKYQSFKDYKITYNFLLELYKTNKEFLDKNSKINKDVKLVLEFLNEEIIRKNVKIINKQPMLIISHRYLAKNTNLSLNKISKIMKQLEEEKFVQKAPIEVINTIKNKKFNNIGVFIINQYKENNQLTLEDFIKTQIAEKGYCSKQKMEDFCQLNNISKNQIRSAIKKLKKEGVRYVKPNKRLKEKYNIKTDHYILL